MNCLFCGASPPLSREHLVSRLVARAFGIDRSKSLSTVERGAIVRSASLEQLAVRLPCASCNSGWMNGLEHGMASVARWTRDRDAGLSREGHETLRRWLLKSYIVMTAIDGGARRFGSDDTFSMLPDATRARRLWEGDRAAFDNVATGYARRARPFPNNFGYAIGNPTVIPVGARRANCRSAGAAMFGLGNLEAWIVVPVLAPTITLPATLRELNAGDRFKRLPVVERSPDIADVVVDNGDHDWPTIADALVAWAETQPHNAA